MNTLTLFSSTAVTQYIAVFCRCLAAFDQLLCTSRSAPVRNLSSIKMAHISIFINVFFWSCIHAPNLFYQNAVRSGPVSSICIAVNQVYNFFYSNILTPVIYFFVPLVILIGSMVRTLMNMKQMGVSRVMQPMEKQMVLVRLY
jgi:hypothetical protein